MRETLPVFQDVGPGRCVFSGYPNKDVGFVLLMHKPWQETRDIKVKLFHRFFKPQFTSVSLSTTLPDFKFILCNG